MLDIEVGAQDWLNDRSLVHFSGREVRPRYKVQVENKINASGRRSTLVFSLQLNALVHLLQPVWL